MKKLALVWFSLLLVGCASSRVIVDTKGVDLQQYNIDLAECNAYRDSLPTSDGVGESAIAAFLVGAALGAIFGNSDDAIDLGTSAAIESGAEKAISNGHEQNNIVKSCMAQRGYSVLN